MVRIYGKTVARWHSDVIDFTVDWSFGEQHAKEKGPLRQEALRKAIEKLPASVGAC
jgi:hypothetical protein